MSVPASKSPSVILISWQSYLVSWPGSSFHLRDKTHTAPPAPPAPPSQLPLPFFPLLSLLSHFLGVTSCHLLCFQEAWEEAQTARVWGWSALTQAGVASSPASHSYKTVFRPICPSGCTSTVLSLFLSGSVERLFDCKEEKPNVICFRRKENFQAGVREKSELQIPSDLEVQDVITCAHFSGICLALIPL